MLKKILALEERVTVICFLVALVAILWQIISRYVFNSPSTWTEELSRLLYVYMACLGIHMAQRENLHVRIDSLYNVFGPGLKRAVDTLIAAVLCLVFCYLAYKSVQVVQRKLPIPLVTLGGISSSFLYVNLVILSVTLALRFAVEVVTGPARPAAPAEGDPE